MLTVFMLTRRGQTYGFVLLRQKNALPSGIGRTFSLGGARSAIFNWTPPSDRRRRQDRRRGGEKKDKAGDKGEEKDKTTGVEERKKTREGEEEKKDKTGGEEKKRQEERHVMYCLKNHELNIYIYIIG